jgi:meiotic recombination protein REC8
VQGFDGVAEDISQPATPIQGLHFEPGEYSRPLVSPDSHDTSVVGPPPSSPLAGTAQSHKSASMNPMSPQAEPAAQQANDQQVVGGDDANPPRKAKRARLLLDARTELTDEELKVSAREMTFGHRSHPREGRPHALLGRAKRDSTRTGS